MLTGTDIQHVQRHAREDGYAVVEGMLSPAEVDQYGQRMDDYLYQHRSPPEGMSIPRPAPRADGQGAGDLAFGVNRIYGLETDDLFLKLAGHPAIVGVLGELLSPNLRLLIATAVLNPPQVGGGKGMHQDAAGMPVEGKITWSAWIAFDPTTPENGCLTFIHRSHKWGPVSTETVKQPGYYDPSQVVTVPMAPGSCVFFHSLTMHASANNRTDHRRRAVSYDYAAAEHRYTGPEPKPSYPLVSGVAVPGGI